MSVDGAELSSLCTINRPFPLLAGFKGPLGECFSHFITVEPLSSLGKAVVWRRERVVLSYFQVFLLRLTASFIFTFMHSKLKFVQKTLKFFTADFIAAWKKISTFTSLAIVSWACNRQDIKYWYLSSLPFLKGCE